MLRDRSRREPRVSSSTLAGHRSARTHRTTRGLSIGLVIVGSLACGRGAQEVPLGPRAKARPATAAQVAAAWVWDVPRGLEPPVAPEDNPMSRPKVELGHRLFMDRRLSVDGSRSCYSCHRNELGNADGRPTALGAADKPLPRNTPTIWNVAYAPSLYWDGRAPNLEAQAIGALKGGNMGLGDALSAKAAEVGASSEYRPAFEQVFGLGEGEAVTPEHVAGAISAYERTLLCGDTRFDRQELDPAAQRGQAIFMGKASCVTCHNGAVFSDGQFHVTGIGVHPADPTGDLGRGKVTGSEGDRYKFRTPSLRNVAKTGPYFHDGSVATLDAAVRLMAGGGRPEVVPVDNLLLDRKLSESEISDVVAFLRTLDCPQTLEVMGEQPQ